MAVNHHHAGSRVRPASSCYNVFHWFCSDWTRVNMGVISCEFSFISKFSTIRYSNLYLLLNGGDICDKAGNCFWRLCLRSSKDWHRKNLGKILYEWVTPAGQNGLLKKIFLEFHNLNTLRKLNLPTATASKKKKKKTKNSSHTNIVSALKVLSQIKLSLC